MLVQLVRDLSGPEAATGCMLLDTVYKASASGIQVSGWHMTEERGVQGTGEALEE